MKYEEFFSFVDVNVNDMQPCKLMEKLKMTKKCT